MRIHHLNCISSCPLQPGKRLSTFFLALLSPDFREDMTAIRQIENLGYNPQDVRHIVLTHLDFDHAGGLDDFPNATVHLMDGEKKYAELQKTWLDRQRFRPAQWSTRKHWKGYDPEEEETWFGFQNVRHLKGLTDDILMIPLRGHTFGHAGVAIRNESGWLLNAGDAYFYPDEMNFENPRCTSGLQFYQWLMEKDRSARLDNQFRLRTLKRKEPNIRIFNSHDVAEFEALSGHSATVPAGLSSFREVTKAGIKTHRYFSDKNLRRPIQK